MVDPNPQPDVRHPTPLSAPPPRRLAEMDVAPTGVELTFGAFLAERVETRAVEITRAWVDVLTDRLGESPVRVLPTDSLLNHIPAVLRKIADFIRDPSDDPITPFVLEDLSALAELRRRQGFPIEEILTEFEILSALMQREVEDAVAEFSRPVDPVAVTRTIGRFKDAVFAMGTLTARRYRIWRTRQDQERTAVLSTFTAMLSHELGNRLGAAETAVRLLMDPEVEIDGKRADQIRRLILKSLGGALDAVRDVHAISDPDGNGTETTLRRLPMDLVLREAIRQVRLRAGGRGIDIRLAGPAPGAPVDVSRFPVVLSNLLGNAIKYHDCATDEPAVRVRVHEHGAFWRVDVEDDGPGIPDDLRERVFEANVRGDHGESGSGLGLAISREAVEQMGGSIWVESAFPRGTLFSFTVPRVAPEDASNENSGP